MKVSDQVMAPSSGSMERSAKGYNITISCMAGSELTIQVEIGMKVSLKKDKKKEWESKLMQMALSTSDTGAKIGRMDLARKSVRMEVTFRDALRMASRKAWK